MTLISIKNARAKDPALFISWSKGVVINRRTFEKSKIIYKTEEDNKKYGFVSDKILGDKK